MSSALARSMSTGSATAETGSSGGADGSAEARERSRREVRARDEARDRPRSTLADSTRAICAASAPRVSWTLVGDSLERTRRTAPPSAISAARNSSALRSALVTEYGYDFAARIPKRYRATMIETRD